MSMLKNEDTYISLKRAAAITAANAATPKSGEILKELAIDLFDKIQVEKRK